MAAFLMSLLALALSQDFPKAHRIEKFNCCYYLTLKKLSVIEEPYELIISGFIDQQLARNRISSDMLLKCYKNIDLNTCLHVNEFGENLIYLDEFDKFVEVDLEEYYEDNINITEELERFYQEIKEIGEKAKKEKESHENSEQKIKKNTEKTVKKTGKKSKVTSTDYGFPKSHKSERFSACYSLVTLKITNLTLLLEEYSKKIGNLADLKSKLTSDMLISCYKQISLPVSLSILEQGSDLALNPEFESLIPFDLDKYSAENLDFTDEHIAFAQEVNTIKQENEIKAETQFTKPPPAPLGTWYIFLVLFSFIFLIYWAFSKVHKPAIHKNRKKHH